MYRKTGHCQGYRPKPTDCGHFSNVVHDTLVPRFVQSGCPTQQVFTNSDAANIIVTGGPCAAAIPVFTGEAVNNTILLQHIVSDNGTEIFLLDFNIVLETSECDPSTVPANLTLDLEGLLEANCPPAKFAGPNGGPLHGTAVTFNTADTGADAGMPVSGTAVSVGSGPLFRGTALETHLCRCARCGFRAD